MRYSYNRQITPAAPFVHVVVSDPNGEMQTADVPAQLDTAADRSVVPRSVIDALGVPQLDALPAIGFGGHLTTVPTFLVRLAVRGFAPQPIEVFASPEEPFILLGRDVLNGFSVTLDGPSQMLEINDPSQS